MHQDKIIVSEQEGINLLSSGIDKLDIVVSTLGPKGANVLFANMYNYPQITNDGVTVAKQVKSDNEIEQLAIDTIVQASLRTNQMAGDGTTTSMCLAQAIWREGLKSDKNPNDIRREINEDCAKVITELKKMAKPISTFEEIKRIATISAESEEIGTLIAEATEKVGKDGQIIVQESETAGLTVEYTNGLEIEEGIIIPHMANTERGTAEVKDPYILLVDSKLSNIKDILPAVDALAANGIRQLIVICDGMDGNVPPTVVQNKFPQRLPSGELSVPFEIIGVRIPAVRKPDWIEDIAYVTGAKVFGMSTGNFPKDAFVKGVPFDQIQQYFGRCAKFVATEKKTTLIGGVGDVQEKVKTLKLLRDADEVHKDVYDTRIARLLGQTAVLKIGAPTSAELDYLKLKIDDAVCATKAAMEEGVVKGGGLALVDITHHIDLGDILARAITVPWKQIQNNAGGNLEIGEDVFDPVKVTRLALENACSCAGTLLTCKGNAIANKRITPQ